MTKRTSLPLYLTALALWALVFLTACGGGGGGSAGIDPNADDDGDGFKNSADIDDDNDGLIEITTLKQLDWMRNDLVGTSQTDHNGIVVTDGCPAVDGCNGYELMVDLDFDINGDGYMGTEDRPYFDYEYDDENNGWRPVGYNNAPFRAHFEGNNHRISNLYINRDRNDRRTGGTYIGLFGIIDGSSVSGGIEIRNLVLDGALMKITGNSDTAGLVGYATGDTTIRNCTISGVVTGINVNTGGLVGAARNTVTIENSTASGTVSGNTSTGGLVGIAEITVNINNSTASGAVSGNTATGGLVGFAVDTITIDNSTASGAVDGEDLFTGGLVGNALASVTIDNSTASGTVTGGTDFTGGLLGIAQDTVTIRNSTASGAVDGGRYYTGGLLGLARNTIIIRDSYASGAVSGTDYLGGLVGSVNFLQGSSPYTATSNIDNSFATGTVSTSGSGDFVGGLVGLAYYLILNDNFATGEVSSSGQHVGGLVGSANAGTLIRRCFAANTVTGNINVGSMVGYSEGASYVYSYFSDDQGLDALGLSVNPAGLSPTGAPLADLQATTSAGSNGLFTGWDSVSVWDFGSSSQLPGLIIDGTVYRDGNADGVLD